MYVIVVKRHNLDSYNAPPPQVVAIAVDDAAAIRWIQDEVDGKHQSGMSYAQGHDASWWIDYGTFTLTKTEVIGSVGQLVEIDAELKPRMERILTASEGLVPISFDTIVNMALEAWCEGSEESMS